MHNSGSPLRVATIWSEDLSKDDVEATLAHALKGMTHGRHHEALTAYQGDHHHTRLADPVHSLAYDNQLGVQANLWHHGAHYYVAVLGSPEHVLARCDLTSGEAEHIGITHRRLADTYTEVIAVADMIMDHPITTLAELPHTLRFVALLALTDKQA